MQNISLCSFILWKKNYQEKIQNTQPKGDLLNSLSENT